MKNIALLFLLAVVLISCNENLDRDTDTIASENNIEKAVEKLNQLLIQATLEKDFDLAKDIYLDSCLLLADYQPMLDGKSQVKAYYEEIFNRQTLTNYTKTTLEVFDFEKLVLEIGTFNKDFSDQESHRGKYFNVWQKSDTGELLLKAEAFGYFKNLDDPEALVVKELKDESIPLLGRAGKTIPMEIQAYHALGQNRVRDRDTKAVVDSYTPDGVYYPFADSAKTGYEGLLKHFTAYHKNPVKIDSIETWSYDYDLVKDGMIWYSKFYVKWTVPGYTGESSGTGISYWKRTKDNAWKKYRQIGMHIHDAD